ASATLELRMHPRAEDVDRPAIAVEARIPDVLVVAGDPDRAQQVRAVEDLEHALGALVQVDAAELQIARMDLRDPAEPDAHAGVVEVPAPQRALRDRADAEVAIGRVERV